MMARTERRLPPVSKPKVLLVEGQDEVKIFQAMVKKEDLEAEIEVREMKGRTNLSDAVKGLTEDSGWKALGTSLGIVLDADNHARRRFESARTALQIANLPIPNEPLKPAESSAHRTMVMIVPPGKPSGMLEDVFLMSVADDPAMDCVDKYFNCLAGVLPKMPRPTSKALLRAFLASWEVLEESHSGFVAEHLQEWVPDMPSAPSSEKVHAFLASRSKPTLDLGTSVNKREGYWDLDHVAFNEMREFLREL